MLSLNFLKYLFVMALVTYLVRMLPLVLVKTKIKNRFIVSFLHYIPCSVLTVMTIPAIFYAASFIPSVIGFIAAVLMAYFGKSLVAVAATSCICVFITEVFMTLV